MRIAARVPVRWNAGPRSIPAWLDRGADRYGRGPNRAVAEFLAVSASTAYHEAIEAIRWARRLIASGKAEPADIAIASVNPLITMTHFLALRADANLDLHFVHGVKVTSLQRGPGRRGAGRYPGAGTFANPDAAPGGPARSLSRSVSGACRKAGHAFCRPMLRWHRLERWSRLIDRLTAADWPDGIDHGSGAARHRLPAVAGACRCRPEIGREPCSQGSALAIWRKALLAGPAASLDMTLEALKQDDGLDACVSVAWMPASALAASPRRFVRLLGLNSSRWPRGISEDRLLSDHIIPTAELDPLPVGAADRRDFETILATTERQVVLSRARRDSDGRLLGRSTLLQRPARRNLSAAQRGAGSTPSAKPTG